MFFSNKLVDRVGAGRPDDEGVSVGVRLRDEIGGDVAAGAGLVLDDELLAVFFRKLLRHKAAENVGGAAGENGTMNFTGRRAMRRPSRSGSEMA
jgi:hypothetical protein